MAALNDAAFAAVFKQKYPSKKVKYVGYQGNPLLALMPKDTDFGGDVFKIPIHYGGNQGASHNFTKAQTNKTASLTEAFLLTRKQDYGLTSIETMTLQASRSSAHAFLKAADLEINNLLRTVGRNLAVRMYRNSGGARGQVGSTSSANLTLKKTSDVVNFEKGMFIDSDDTDGTSGAVDGDPRQIGSINRLTGVLTLASGTWTSGGNYANDDFLFRDGDFGASISGLDDWLPAAAPGATPFYGVARNADVTRLGGLRLDAATLGYTLEEALEAADVLVSREGGMPSHVFMNHDDYGELRRSLGSRVQYDLAKSPDARISFKGIVLSSVSGGPDIKVIADRNCPTGVAYMLQMDTWVLATIGAAPKILEGLGNRFIWDYNADSIEIRSGWYGNMGCFAPGFNCRITLPS